MSQHQRRSRPARTTAASRLLSAAALSTATLHAAAPSHAQTATGATTSAATNARFPFVMPWDDASKTITDVSFLNPAPLTEAHRISTRNGHFYDTTGRRVRFLGANFVAGANFLSKADAVKVAARMRKMGFNMVRLHHMDASWAQPSIFGGHRDAANLPNEIIAPDSLDALDYLVFQLKKNGIYVDLNLHVAWTPNAASGYPDTDKLPDGNKGISYFEKRAIEHQRSYARQFLTHVNPYTKMRWADDPTIAVVEINNEDTLLGEAWNGTLLKFTPYYLDQLTTRWNAFLKAKYGATSGLKTAWMGSGLSTNVVQNARFANGVDGWTKEMQEGDYNVAVEDIAGQSSTGNAPQGRALHFDIRGIGSADWKQQWHQNGLTFQNGETYTVTFWAKADKTRPLGAYIGLDQAPWGQIGPGGSFSLSSQWTKYTLVVTTQNPIPAHSRLSFTVGGATGQLWIADVAVQRGVSTEIGNQSIEAGTMQMAMIDNSARGRDMTAFLMDVEARYSLMMRDYIKKDLGSKSLVTCSQAWLGGLGGVVREARMDWVDMHSYWQHPEFPGTAWSASDWRIDNTPMVREKGGGTMPFLAQHRVAGKPFTVTEYNHPAPNDYASETLPFMAALGAVQDWDGLFLFDYHADQGNWDIDRLNNFFSVANDPNKMVTMPAAALMFLGNQVPSAAATSELVVPRGSAVSLLTTRKPSNFWDSNMGGLWGAGGWKLSDMMQSRVAIRLVDGSGPVRLNRVLDASQKNVLNWKTDVPANALFTVDAPKAKSLVGFLGGRTTRLDGFQVTMAQTTRSFATVMLNAKDNRPLQTSSSLLLTALNNVENQNMGWNADRTSVGTKWGNGPLMAEGIPATIALRTQATKATVYALDARGARSAIVPSKLQNGTLSFVISARYKALWYEIAATVPARAQKRVAQLKR